MTPKSLVATVEPRTGKINKNGPVFLKEEKIGFKMVKLHFVFKLSRQSSKIVLRS